MEEKYFELYKRIKNVLEEIYSDNSIINDIEKCFFQASLFKMLNYKNYVEIGSEQGRSLFSVSFAVANQKGNVYAIDPYLPEHYNSNMARESDCEDIFNKVMYLKSKFGLEETIKIVRQLPELGLKELITNNIKINMLRIDGNFNYSLFKNHINSYFSLIDSSGIVILDNFEKNNFDEIYINNKDAYKLIYQRDSFYVLVKCNNKNEKVHCIDKVNEGIEEIFLYYNKFTQYGLMDDLVIMDDFFPHYNSPFRYGEFNEYLKEFENIKIYANGSSVHLIEDRKILDIVKEYKVREPKLSNRVIPWTGSDFPETLKAKVAYFCFLRNVFCSIESIEKNSIPFIFELYPGGGLQLNDYECDERLRRVLSSPFFRKVIVTQKVTKDYLLEKKFCVEDKIEFIYGGVIPKEKLFSGDLNKDYFGNHKNTLDICFVANKYTEYGKDKGYDIFIEAAKILCEKYSNILFHVVGGFDENVIDVSNIKENIIFYGTQNYDWFNDFYLDKDIILSPTQSGHIRSGSFDGFPTTACIDAALRETAIFSTCEFDIGDSYFEDDKNIIIVEHSVQDIVHEIEKYYNEPDRLRNIAISGRKVCLRLFSYESQIQTRINVIKKEIENYEGNLKLSLEIYKNKITKSKNDYIELRQGYINLEDGYKNLSKEYINIQGAYINLKEGYALLSDENNEIKGLKRNLEIQYNNLLNDYDKLSSYHSKVLSDYNILLNNHSALSTHYNEFKDNIEKTMWWKLIGRRLINKNNT